MRVSDNQLAALTKHVERQYLNECEAFFRDHVDSGWLNEKTSNLSSYLEGLLFESKQLHLDERVLITKYMLACVLTDENDIDEKKDLMDLKRDLKEGYFYPMELLNNYLKCYEDD